MQYLFSRPSFAGAGESGKTTIMKQFQLAEDGGKFSDDERSVYAAAVRYNVVSSAKILAGHLKEVMDLSVDMKVWHVQESSCVLTTGDSLGSCRLD